MAADLDDADIKKQVLAKMSDKFPDVDPGRLRELVDIEFGAIADRPVRDYLGVLTERAVRKRLKQPKA